MSVLVEFSIFPVDKGDSVSKYVAEVVTYIKNSNFESQLTSMGTIFETEKMSDALEIINQSYLILSKYSSRIYATAKFDIRDGKNNRILSKILSVEEKI